MAVTKNIAFIGASIGVRQCFSTLNFVLQVLVFAKRTGVRRRSSGRLRFYASLYPMTVEIA